MIKKRFKINILPAPVDLTYATCTFENLSGTQISSFGTEDGVVAKVQFANPSQADAQQKGVLFAALYNGNKLVGMKRFGDGTIPAGSSVITTQLFCYNSIKIIWMIPALIII